MVGETAASQPEGRREVDCLAGALTARLAEVATGERWMADPQGALAVAPTRVEASSAVRPIAADPPVRQGEPLAAGQSSGANPLPPPGATFRGERLTGGPMMVARLEASGADSRGVAAMPVAPAGTPGEDNLRAAATPVPTGGRWRAAAPIVVRRRVRRGGGWRVDRRRAPVTPVAPSETRTALPQSVRRVGRRPTASSSTWRLPVTPRLGCSSRRPVPNVLHPRVFISTTDTLR